MTVACGEPRAGTAPTAPDEPLTCDLEERFLADGGVGRDGIPALTDPRFLPAEPRVDATSYFKPTDRVIAYWASGEWLVIPHNIMWRHEIVNLPEVAVTYCPLTGSALAFARGDVGGAEFGVSGLLYHTNLILYDRSGSQISLWPQMLGEARCGPKAGQRLTRVPVYEMTWEGWISLHPDSKILALSPGMFDPALYFANPYGSEYDEPGNGDFLGFPIGGDPRRPPKERVLGVPDGAGGGLAFPFLAMAARDTLAVFPFEQNGERGVVFWDDARQAAMAFYPFLGGQEVTFRIGAEGIVDDVTGSGWAVDGTPISGPLAGSKIRLNQVPGAYVAFWRAWSAFHPATVLALTGGL